MHVVTASSPPSYFGWACREFAAVPYPPAMERSSTITRSRSRYSTSHGSRTSYSSAVYFEDDANKEGEPLLSVSERSIINVSDDDDDIADPRENKEAAISVSHLRCPTRAGIKRSCRIRCLTSKPVVFILALNALVCYAFFGLTQKAVVQSVLKDTMIESRSGLIAVIQQGLEFGIAYLCYPLGGLLADVYVGRHLTMKICLLIVWLANAVFSLSAAFGSNLAGSAGAAEKSALLTWLPAVCLVVNSIGGGVFQISLLVFGGDQLCDAPSDVVSSYIYWVYWTKNLGGFLGWLLYTGVAIMQPLDTDIKQLNFVPALQPMLAVIALTAALVFDMCTSKHYDVEHKNTNPIRLICGVIRNSKQWRRPPPFMSAFRYGEDPPSGLDFARQHHGGRYTDEEVEDVRTFGRVMVFILSLSAFLLPYNGVSITDHKLSHCYH